MTGIDKITARIAAEAEERGRDILTKAQAEAGEITARYRLESEQTAAEAAEKSRREAVERRERRVGVAELEARKELLAAKQEMIAEVFDRALARLQALPEPELIAFMAGLAADAAVTGEEQIVMSPGDHTRFGKKICESANKLCVQKGKKGALTLSAAPRVMDGGGLMLSDGAVEINCSFATLLNNAKNDMIPEVVNLLF